MIQRYKACSAIVSHARIVLNENQSKITFINAEKKEIEKVKVDGCALKEGIKCDYLLIEDSMEHYIELKGSDVEHAIKQLITTINKLSINPRTFVKSSYVVSSRCPLSSPRIQGLQLKFKKDFNSKLIMKKMHCEISL